MPITFPSNTAVIIDEIRGVIGRDVTFYTHTREECPVCDIDPVTDTSTDSFCTTCSGNGYIYTYSGTSVSGHITYSPSSFSWVVGGQYPEGDCRVQIKYTPEILVLAEESDYVIIDGKKYDVKKIMLRGVKEINRILIDTIERV